ncbi:hypothetical protein CHLNCDRAFT_138505 [Chlorella variabilis]|uniref:Amino acid transporter transmembrane domain-containing protein n=1 Tax=Chlorella variabilis TaxID=554065 RepID=E1ZN71_CHLVA|nr:hypothetical protein CHLNCDRAFT_138505 [Chlorella variabilis]EFN52920.1 hypothetical protein CHLNCDRAFT_138505 [Chlorella variabilis]|eukprot:XP_005845022.1 hypothetical protein CHLNCDRAFT_138505 [Chlorella variabilis]
MAAQPSQVAAPHSHPLHRHSGAHPLSKEVSAVASSLAAGDYEEESLLPSPHGHHHAIHKHSFSGQLDSRLHAFQVAFFKPPPSSDVLLHGGGLQERQGSTLDAEPFLTMKDVQPSEATREWLMVGLTLQPKLAWGWLPFAFSFLGFSVALKLLLFCTLFSVYSAAILYRLYLHTDKQGKLDLADIGEAAFGKRLGRRPVLFFCRLINIALPTICHVGGTRFLQVALFYTTGVCLPWISLLFGATVLGLVQIQRLGSHPSLIRIVQPALTVVAVAATLLKLLLMRAQQGQAPQVLALDADEASSIYLSDYVIAVVQLISANYMGQHFFMEEMSSMGAPSTFQHSTAWAQVVTLLANVAVAVATLRVQPLHPHSFISFAFGPDLLSRFINLVLWALMTVKSVVALHLGTKSLLPRLPHLLVNWFDPDGVDSSMHIKPRQLWFLCSSILVLISYVVSGTFPHTFMYLSGLLVSVAYVPIAFTLPCMFSLKLLANQITALEYTLSTWVIPVSIVMSLMGCWACLYQMVLKWNSVHHGGSWVCNLVVPH